MKLHLTRALYGFCLVVVAFGLNPLTPIAQNIAYEPTQLGRSSIQTLKWSPNGEILAVGAGQTIWLYDSELQDIAYLDLVKEMNHDQWIHQGELHKVESTRIGTIQWSPDSRWLLVQFTMQLENIGWQNTDWQIWEWQGSNNFVRLFADVSIWSIRWKPDSTQFAIVSDEYVSLYSADTVQLLDIFEAHELVWSGDNRFFAIVTSEAVKLFDSASHQLLTTLPDHEKALTRAIWSPDNTKLAGVGSNRLLIWDIPTGKLVSVLIHLVDNPYPEYNPAPILRAGIEVIAWTPDSDFLAVVYEHPVTPQLNDLIIWKVANASKFAPVKTIGAIQEMLGSPTANQLITTDIYIGGWNDTGKPISDQIFFGIGFAQNLSKSLLASYERGGTRLKLYDLTTLLLIDEFATDMDRIRNIDWKPDTTQIVIASADEMQIWDVETGEIQANNVLHFGYESAVVGWSANGRYLAIMSGSIGGRHTTFCASLRIWDAQNQTFINTSIKGRNFGLIAHWSPDGAKIALANRDFVESWTCLRQPTLDILNVSTGEIISINNDVGIQTFTWNSDGTQLIAATIDGSLLFLDATTLQIVKRVEHISETFPMSLYKTPNLLIVHAWDEQTSEYMLHLLDIETGQLLLSQPLNNRSFYVSETSDQIVFHDSNSLQIFRIVRDNQDTMLQPVRVIPIEDEPLFGNSLNLMADRIVGINADGHVKSWDLQSGEVTILGTVDTAYLTDLKSFGWHPDAVQFATTQYGGIVNIWAELNKQ